MLFNSYIFLLFLPIVLIGYFLLNRFEKNIYAKCFLIISSLFFYAYNDVRFGLLMCCSVCINYLIYYFLIQREQDSKMRKIGVSFGILFNILVLCYFKYVDFFIENINMVLAQSIPLRNVILPLGISFYTLQQVGFLIDSYKGETGKINAIDYGVFVTFFPQLVAGPIVSHDEMICQFNDKEKLYVNWSNIACGLYGFTLGFAKKVLIADVFGVVVNSYFTIINSLTTMDVIILMLSYTFQIYFDFSGYCDMASGIAKMFNITLPINFNSPYKSYHNLGFWKGWHITLTRFFTKYVYIPLGGSKKGKLRTYVNVMLVFFISGFWHGAAWTFVLWGVIHGIANICTRIFKEQLEKCHTVVLWIANFFFINFTWLIFRVESLEQLKIIITRLFTFSFGVNLATILEFKTAELDLFFKITGLINRIPYYNYIFMIIFVVGAVFIVLNTENVQIKMQKFKETSFRSIFIAGLLFLCICSLQTVSTFLYFNF